MDSSRQALQTNGKVFFSNFEIIFQLAIGWKNKIRKDSEESIWIKILYILKVIMA